MNFAFDFNKFLESYSKKDFIKDVFKEVIKENPEIIARHISSQIIVDVMQSNGYQSVKDGVDKYIKEKLSESYNSDLDTMLCKIMDVCVDENKRTVTQKVQELMRHDGFKENIATKISDTIKERVLMGLDAVDDHDHDDY